MKNYLVPFEDIPWEYPQEGVEQKVFVNGTKRMRLIIFRDNFEEPDWCHKGHVGLVLEGEMMLDFNGELVLYKQGDGIWIEPGEQSKHRGIIPSGKYAKLIVFENSEN